MKISKKKLKSYWTTLELIEDEYWENISDLEKKIAKETGIENIELFHVDGSVVGIGTSDKKMKLIHRD